MINFKNDDKLSFGKSLIWGTGFSYLITAILVIISALVITFSDVKVSTVLVIATVVISIASTVGGYMAAKIKGSSPLPVGLATGFVFYITIAVISALVTSASFSELFLLRLILCVVLAGVGAVLKTLKRSNKGYI